MFYICSFYLKKSQYFITTDLTHNNKIRRTAYYIFMSKKKEARIINLVPASPPKQQAQPVPILSSADRAKSILSQIQFKLLHDISQQSISIPIKPVPFITDTQRKKNQQQQQQWLKLQKVIQEKEEIKRRLKQVQSNQKLVHAGLNLSSIRDRSITSLRPKSQLSVQDIQKLKKLKHEQSKFQKQLEGRTKIFQENTKRMRQQQQQLIEKSKRQNNQKKKIQITKRLQQLSERQSERAKKFEQQKRHLTKLKLQTKLHEQLNLKWEKLEAQNQQNKLKHYEQRKKEKSVDISQIKQHEKKYQQILRKNRQQISKKRIQASRVSHKLFKQKIHQTKFHTIILQQQQRRKKFQDQKKQQKAELIERKRQFNQFVRENHASKLKIKSEQDEQQFGKKIEVKKIILDPQQIRRKGLQYLEQAKSKASKNAKDKSFQLSKVSQIQPKVPKYHNYLSETRKTRQQSDGKSIRLQKNFESEVQQAKKIMKRTAFSDKQKIQRVKILAQRLQSDPKNTKSSTLLKKIQAKIQILQALQ